MPLSPNSGSPSLSSSSSKSDFSALPRLGPSGLLVTTILLVLTHVISFTPYKVNTPGGIWFIAVVYATINNGLKVGLYSATLTCLYAAYYYSIPGQPFHYAPRDNSRVFLLALSIYSITLMVGLLQRRAEKLHTAQTEERILRQSRDWLVTTLQSIGDAVIATDTSSRVIFMNPVAQNVTGWTEEEARGRDLIDVFPIINEGTRLTVTSPVEEVLRTGSIVGLANHTLLKTRDGKEIPIDDSGAPIRDENGDTIGVVLVFRDVTERKQTEETIRRSETLFRATVEESPIAILIMNPEGEIVRTNRAWEKLWHVSREVLQNYNILQDAQIERMGFMPQLQSTFSGERFDMPLVHYDPARNGQPGRSRWVQPLAYPVKDEGKVTEVVLMIEDATERQMAHEAMRYSEERYHSLVYATAQIVWIAAPDGYWLETPTWQAFTGQSRDEVQGFGWLNAVHPEDREQTEADWRSAIARRGRYEAQYRIRRRDGIYRLVEVRGIPLLEDTGATREWVGSCHDISDEKYAESIIKGQKRVLEMVARGEDLQKTLVVLAEFIQEHATADCCIFLLNKERTHIRVAVAPSLPAELVSILDNIAVTAETGSCGAALTCGEMVIVEDILNDPLEKDFVEAALQFNLRSCWSQPIFDSDHNTIGTFAMFHNETGPPRESDLQLIQAAGDLAGIAIERTETERDLMQALAQQSNTAANLSAILLNIADGVIVVDNSGKITFANQVAHQLHNVKELGATLAAYATVRPTFNLEGEPRESSELPLFRAWKKDEVVLGEEWQIEYPNGKRIIVQGNASPVRSEQGLKQGAVLTLRDVTAQRKIVEELQHVNKMKDEFLAVLSHELRTPLTPIMGWISLLKQTNGSDANLFSQAIASIERNADLQRRLVDDLLDTSRIVSGKLNIYPQAGYLNEIADLAVRTVEATAAEREIQVHSHFDFRIPPAVFDPERMQQVMLNLLSNAVKFSPNGGTVLLRTALNNEAIHPQAQIEVIDNGEGIAPDLLPHIFEVFRQGDSSFTRKHGGLGLGLSISKSLVVMHGGTLTAASEGIGKGTRFTVEIPLVAVPTEGESEANQAALY
jgi:PAS domain S-box-containing protein